MENNLEKIKAGFCAGFNFNHKDWKNGNKELDFSEKEGCFDHPFCKAIGILINNPDVDKSVYLTKVKNSVCENKEEILPYINLYAEALYMMCKGCSRVEIWDALFESPNIENKTVYRHLLDSYYIFPDHNVDDDYFVNDYCYIMQIALYLFWHDITYIQALNKGSLKYDKPFLLASIGSLCSKHVPLVEG